MLFEHFVYFFKTTFQSSRSREMLNKCIMFSNWKTIFWIIGIYNIDPNIAIRIFSIIVQPYRLPTPPRAAALLSLLALLRVGVDCDRHCILLSFWQIKEQENKTHSNWVRGIWCSVLYFDVILFLFSRGFVLCDSICVNAMSSVPVVFRWVRGPQSER